MVFCFALGVFSFPPSLFLPGNVKSRRSLHQIRRQGKKTARKPSFASALRDKASGCPAPASPCKVFKVNDYSSSSSLPLAGDCEPRRQDAARSRPTHAVLKQWSCVVPRAFDWNGSVGSISLVGGKGRWCAIGFCPSLGLESCSCLARHAPKWEKILLVLVEIPLVGTPAYLARTNGHELFTNIMAGMAMQCDPACPPSSAHQNGAEGLG